MGAPDEFHDEAHQKAREITGERRYGEWGQCIATAKSAGRRCRGYAQGPHGKCTIHGGADDSGAPEGNDNAEGNDGGGAPEDNTNAVTHGAYADHNTYYQNVLDDEMREFVDDVFGDYLEQYKELHGEPPLGIEAELFRIAVTHAKDIGLDRWTDEKPGGLESGHALVDRETEERFVEAIGPVTKETYRESVVLQAQKKLSTDRRQWLKDLGLLEDPQSQTAAALGDLKDAWKASAQGGDS
jgi:hypothetical protein